MRNDQFIKHLRTFERIIIIMLFAGIVVTLIWNLANFLKIYNGFNEPYASYPLLAGYIICLLTIFLVSWYKNVGKGDVAQNHEQYKPEEIQEKLMKMACTFFSARDIMIRRDSLKCGSNESEARYLLSNYPNYDVVPIEKDGNISSYLERGSSQPITIHDNDCVIDSTNIFKLIDIFQERKFSFVVDKNGVTGYIHFSDFNNHIAKLPYFILIELLEDYLIQVIRPSLNQEILKSVLGEEKLTKLEKILQKQRKQAADLDIISLLSFDEIIQCSRQMEKLQLKQTEVDKLSYTRNCVCHAGKPLINKHKEIKRLVAVKELCIAILTDTETLNV
jgi:hypothetical protein